MNAVQIVICSCCSVAVFYTQLDGLFTKPAIAKKEILKASALALERDEDFGWQREPRKTRRGRVVPSTFGGNAHL
jgi:hypothetical protein